MEHGAVYYVLTLLTQYVEKPVVEVNIFTFIKIRLLFLYLEWWMIFWELQNVDQNLKIMNNFINTQIEMKKIKFSYPRY